MVGCRLDDTGLEKLAEALTSNVSLEVLDVRNNEFTDNGASQLASADERLEISVWIGTEKLCSSSY
jgi:Ran GTPase-activating protein (RanGAP) involved in mRNA processing and transport